MLMSMSRVMTSLGGTAVVETEVHLLRSGSGPTRHYYEQIFYGTSKDGSNPRVTSALTARVTSN